MDKSSIGDLNGNRQRWTEAVLRGDRQAAEAFAADAPQALRGQWKEQLLDELTDRYLAYEIPFCQLTAAAQGLATPGGAPGRAAVCCGGAPGNTSSTAQNYMMMLLNAWGVPAVDLGMDTTVDAFCRAAEEKGLQFMICTAFSAADMDSVRRLHRAAQDRGLREHVRLLVCGASLKPQELAELPVDFREHRAAAIARWVVRNWKR